MKISSKIVSVFVAASIGKCLADDDNALRGGRRDRDRGKELYKGVRFNKFNVVGSSDDGFTPLLKYDYPISKNGNDDVWKFLKDETDAASVVNVKKDFEVIYDVKDLIDKVGGEPQHPNNDNTSSYWEELREVIEMRGKEDKNPASTELSKQMQLPLRWENYTVYDVAEAVHDEYPGLHQAEFLEDLVVQRKYGEIEFDNKALSKRSGTRFLRGIVALADLHTWSVGVVAPHNFGAKWYAGRARPEEVAFKIYKSEIAEDYVPADIFDSIKNMPWPLDKATDFTQYPEGSPMHPSWPAMHSAASNISFWLQVIMKLTPKQLCEAKKVDYAVAYARTVAGVHFPNDNLAGLNMGQEIVSRALPEHLDTKYDSNKNYVREQVFKKRFDWKDYDELEDCGSLV